MANNLVAGAGPSAANAAYKAGQAATQDAAILQQAVNDDEPTVIVTADALRVVGDYYEAAGATIATIPTIKSIIYGNSVYTEGEAFILASNTAHGLVALDKIVAQALGTAPLVGGHLSTDLANASNAINSAWNSINATLSGELNYAEAILRNPSSTGFDGNQVSLDIYDPSLDPGSLVASGSATVSPTASSNLTPTFSSFAALSPGPNADFAPIAPGGLTLSGDTMSFIFSDAFDGETFNAGSFNGYVLTDNTLTEGDILGATLTSTNIVGLTAADITHTSDSVLVNVAGTTPPTSGAPVINIGVQFANEATHSASSLITHLST